MLSFISLTLMNCYFENIAIIHGERNALSLSIDKKTIKEICCIFALFCLLFRQNFWANYPTNDIWQFELDCNSIWENICQLFALCNFASWAQCVVFKHWWKRSSRLESWIILDWYLHFICTVLSLFGQTFEQITEQQKPSWIFELGCNKFARELRHLSILH